MMANVNILKEMRMPNHIFNIGRYI